MRGAPGFLYAGDDPCPLASGHCVTTQRATRRARARQARLCGYDGQPRPGSTVRGRRLVGAGSLLHLFRRDRAHVRGRRRASRIRLRRIARLGRRRRGGWSWGRRGFRCGCGRRPRGRSGRTPPRKERERVDVGVAVADPDAQVHVREVEFGVSRRTGVRDGGAFGHVLSFVYEQRAEVRERSFVPAGRRNRHGLPVRGDESRERHLACGGGTDLAGIPEPDVDAAMLTRCVRIRSD